MGEEGLEPRAFADRIIHAEAQAHCFESLGSKASSAYGSWPSGRSHRSKRSRSSSSSRGRSAIEPKRKYLRNSFVVPYWTGLPGASFLPTSLTSSRLEKEADHAVGRDAADSLDFGARDRLGIGDDGEGLEGGAREAVLVLLAVALLERFPELGLRGEYPSAARLDGLDARGSGPGIPRAGARARLRRRRAKAGDACEGRFVERLGFQEEDRLDEGGLSLKPDFHGPPPSRVGRRPA